MIRSAVIDGTGMYRYRLERVWAPLIPTRCCFVMLNPSTADGSVDDPTIRRCISFAGSWGYGAMSVVNLFAFRTTYPDELSYAADPIGPGTLTRETHYIALGRAVSKLLDRKKRRHV